MSTAFTRHCAEKRHKMYFMCLWPLGEPFIENAMAILEEEYDGLEYGTDYMSFGYKPGGEAVIKNIIVDWKQLFITDSRKQDLNELPMTANLKSAKAVDLIVNISAGDPGTKQWVQYAATPANMPIVWVLMQAPLLYPYIPSPATACWPRSRGGRLRADPHRQLSGDGGHEGLASGRRRRDAADGAGSSATCS